MSVESSCTLFLMKASLIRKRNILDIVKNMTESSHWDEADSSFKDFWCGVECSFVHGRLKGAT